MQKPEKVIYQPGKCHLQTVVYTDENGVDRCQYSGSLKGLECDQTVSEYLAEPENTGKICVSWDDALKQIHQREEELFITPWKEITEKEYDEMLNVLPPHKWKTVDGVNIFQMSEFTISDITSHYVYFHGKYYTAGRRISTTYETIAQEIKSCFKTKVINGNVKII